MIRFSNLALILLLSTEALGGWQHFVTQTNIFLGEVASNLTAGAPLSVSSTGTVTTGITTVVLNATGNVTTTSGTDAVLSGMTTTPVAGTYWCIFTGSMQQNLAGDFLSVSFYIGGTQDANSIIRTAPFAGGALTAGQGSVPYVTQGVYTVNGSQAIAVEWNVSGGTGTSFIRKLVCLRIG